MTTQMREMSCGVKGLIHASIVSTADGKAKDDDTWSYHPLTSEICSRGSMGSNVQYSLTGLKALSISRTVGYHQSSSWAENDSLREPTNLTIRNHFFYSLRRSTQKPVMTCYKTVTVVFKWSRLLQNKIEGYIQDKYKEIFLSFHQGHNSIEHFYYPTFFLSLKKWLKIPFDSVKWANDSILSPKRINLKETMKIHFPKKLMLNFFCWIWPHQNVWCWTDEWFGMTMDDIRRLEADTKRELEERINDAQKRGNTKIDWIALFFTIWNTLLYPPNQPSDLYWI